jgi:hypothetical protein
VGFGSDMEVSFELVNKTYKRDTEKTYPKNQMMMIQVCFINEKLEKFIFPSLSLFTSH